MFWWGKLTSDDLVHYSEQNLLALKGQAVDQGYFTGSAVIDKKNTAGFGANAMIPIYTLVSSRTPIQSQSLSYSIDTTYTTFQFYQNNPVLDIHKTSFRDPTVFWYAPTSKWIMAVALSDDRKVAFYSSADLKTWTWLSDFGPIGARQGIWECPDLIQIAVDGQIGNKKWVLIVSTGPDNNDLSNGWSEEQRFKEQYFIGSFDGKTFTLDPQCSKFINAGAGLDGTLFSGFDDRSFGAWTEVGKSFASVASRRTVPELLGTGAASSFGGSDTNTGTLTSPRFTIKKSAINFLIGGGYHPRQTCVNLIVGDSIVRTTTGNNSSYLKWRGWDVSDLINRVARIQVVDNYTGSDWGHVDVDQFMLADAVHDENLEQALYLDLGSDYYASRTFKDYDNHLTDVATYGWLANWDYAETVPSTYGKGFWSIARILQLKTYPEGVRLTQRPVAALQKLRRQASAVAFTGHSVCDTTAIPGFTPSVNTYEIDATFTATKAGKFGFILCKGAGRQLVIGYNAATKNLFIDRSKCSDVDIPNKNTALPPSFARTITAAIAPDNNKVRMHIFVDKSSVEIFTGSGKAVLSCLTYPGESQTGVQVFSNGCRGTTLSFSAWMLQSVWHPGESVSPF